MGELNFDPETVDALLADAVPVLSAENLAWQPGAPQAMVDLVVATVEPDQQLSVFPPQTAGREATWMAGESATTGPWALLGVTFVAAPPVRLLLGIERHRKHLTQIANGSHLFLIDKQTRDACRTSADVVERSILVYQGGSDALRQALLTF